MKPEAQAHTIAKLMDWEYYEETGEMAATKDGDILGYSWPSLDAMHEAEKVLNDGQFEEFVYRLCAGERWKRAELNILDAIFTAKATAAQRAEAFLRTLNLWTDES